MLKFFDLILKAGLSIGIVLLNTGIVMLLLCRAGNSQDSLKVANEIVKCAAVLVLVALVFYIW